MQGDVADFIFGELHGLEDVTDCVQGDVVGQGKAAADGVEQGIGAVLVTVSCFEDAEEMIVQVFDEHLIVSEVESPDGPDVFQHLGDSGPEVFAFRGAAKAGVQRYVQAQGVAFAGGDG